MSTTISDNLSELQATYRFMLRMRLLTAESLGDKKGAKRIRAEIAKDEATISQAGKNANTQNTGSSSSDQNVTINLSELIQKLEKLNNPTKEDQATKTTQVSTFYQETSEVKVNLSYSTSQSTVNGLVARNKNLAETDRYRFEFSDGTTLKIVDKWSDRSTTIYGDPHVDTSDTEGSQDGDFKDLTSSDRYTTFMLSDGTRLTITAYDSGVIEEVNIFKGSQHIKGIGSGSSDWDEDSALFDTNVEADGMTASSSLSMGDVVYAGGDGNDWFDASRNLIWGETTGPIVNSKPSSFVKYEYYQKITRSFSTTQIEKTT